MLLLKMNQYFIISFLVIAAALKFGNGAEAVQEIKEVEHLDKRECKVNCSESDIKERPWFCGSNLQVYKSLCDLKQDTCNESATEVAWNQCRGKHTLCPSVCLSIQDPVCGDDGNTIKVYPNKCVMQKRNCGTQVIVKDMKLCTGRVRQGRRSGACPTECLEIYKPVCGSDKLVYINECYLRQKNCGKQVAFMPMNNCVDIPKCPDNCLALYDPVCGSDGRIYINHCRLLQENCGKKVTVKPRSFCIRQR